MRRLKTIVLLSAALLIPVAAPSAGLIGLEIVDDGGGSAKLRYRNAAGVVTEWPGTLPQ